MMVENPEDMLSLRAPLARGITALDRSLFTRTLNLPAATVQDNRNINKYRQRLFKGKELVNFERIDPIRPDPAAQDKKCLLLKSSVKLDVPSTWGPVLQEGIEAKDLALTNLHIDLDYDFWNYFEVMSSILPEDLHDEIPVGFNTAGHVAHLNLRERYLPYKNIIAEVILDKNRTIRTVINKVDNVGEESEFRTFAYEVLAGPNDLNVEVRENDCSFQFDYAKVYWNSKLETEHSRLVNLFQPREVVCDVMAGIGPFAVPSGKKGVFVFANDMNPESYRYLDDAVKQNKVDQYVQTFNQDGRNFIQAAPKIVRDASIAGHCAYIKPKISRSKLAGKPPPPPQKIPLPPTISHFVMNLPASAITFLHHFRGVYNGMEDLFEPHTSAQLPMVHVHCFALKSDDEVPLNDICERIRDEIGVLLRPRLAPGPREKSGEIGNLAVDEVLIHNVRDVAPKKRMFCASFRLPREVAFAEVTKG